jgi:CPA2 family monovalent cation:H+ antiporter-2
VVVSYDDTASALKVLELVQAHAPEVPVVVRTRDDHDLNHLREAGARDVVPEIFEASLSLTSQTLHHIGIPARRVRRLVQAQRQTRYAGFKDDSGPSAP